MVEDDPILGAVLGNYPSDRFRLLLIAGTIGGAAAVILNFTLAAVETWWGPVLTVLLMAIIALILAWYVLHLWNREVILYARGFSYREGARVAFFLYHEIRSIRQRAEQLSYLGGLIRRTVYRVILKTNQDETIILTNLYHRISELSVRLEQAIHMAMVPILTRRLLEGEVINFSETLQMSSKGLHEGGRDLPWDAFSGYKVQRGHLILLRQPGEEWFSIKLSQVDNLLLLVDFLRQRLPETGGNL